MYGCASQGLLISRSCFLPFGYLNVLVNSLSYLYLIICCPKIVVEKSFQQVCSLFLVLLSSLFVLLQGATKDQAFKIGQEIVQAVTDRNPKPVKLKFEKVLNGSIREGKDERLLAYSGRKPVMLVSGDKQ